MFLKPDKLQTDFYTVTNKKERRKRKSTEKRKKAMVAPLVFTIATLELVFGQKKNVWTQNFKGPFGDNVFINLVRYIF